MRILCIFILHSFLQCLFISSTVHSGSKSQNRLILVSLDGFGCRLNDHFHLRSLKRIAETGVSVDYVQNVFPTNTLPNLISIISGLYPENHGMIDNRMFDEQTGNLFILGQKEDTKWWNQFEPIWWTNQKQGFQSSVFYWPGYNIKIHGHLPTFGPSKTNKPPFDKLPLNQSETDMVDQALNLIRNNSLLTLTLLYSHEPDGTLHENPLKSKMNKQQQALNICMQRVDRFVTYLHKKLKDFGLVNNTNVLYIGDHGFTDTSHKRVINLENYVNTKKMIRYMIGFTNAFLYPKSGKLMTVYKRLKNANKHLKVFLKKDIPEAFHIKKNPRTAPLLLLPDPGWVIWADFENISYLKGKFYRGEHGYINTVRKMNPIFLATGPDFKRGYKKRSINTIDIYSLVCHLLGIKPAPNDGSFENIKEILAR